MTAWRAAHAAQAATLRAYRNGAGRKHAARTMLLRWCAAALHARAFAAHLTMHTHPSALLWRRFWATFEADARAYVAETLAPPSPPPKLSPHRSPPPPAYGAAAAAAALRGVRLRPRGAATAAWSSGPSDSSSDDSD